MRLVHYELIRLMRTRVDTVCMIASLKFILKKPVYAPSVEKEQCSHLMRMASQLSLDALSIRDFMRVICKISREIQRKMHAIWSLDQKACLEFLLSQMTQIPMMQFSDLKSKLRVLDEHALFLCNQLMDLLRFLIRFIDIQIITLFCSLTESFSFNFIKQEFGYWPQLPNEAWLYKLFLLINKFVIKEKVCS